MKHQYDKTYARLASPIPRFVADQNRNALQIQCMMGNSSPKRERMMRNAKPQQETKNKCKAVELHVDARDFQAGLTAFELGGEWLV
jgi:hypothetical protein